jgi:hypothetical protein
MRSGPFPSHSHFHTVWDKKIKKIGMGTGQKDNIGWYLRHLLLNPTMLLLFLINHDSIYNGVSNHTKFSVGKTQESLFSLMEKFKYHSGLIILKILILLY